MRAGLALGDGEVHVWWGRSRDVRPWHLELLDEAERARCARLRRQEDRDRFVAGGALMRLALAAYLACEPRDAPLVRTCPDCGQPHGRPRAAGGGGIELSLSHSGERVVVAVGRGSPLGVDVEQLGGPLDVTRLAPRVLSAAELASYRELPAPRLRRAFATYWTRKEAVLKATGDGLRVPLAALTVSPPGARPCLLDWSGRRDAPDRTHLYHLAPGRAHEATLAVIGHPATRIREVAVSLLSRKAGEGDDSEAPHGRKRAKVRMSDATRTLPAKARKAGGRE